MDEMRQQAAKELVELLNNELYHANYSVEGECNESENGFAIIFKVSCNEAESENYPTIELAFDRYTNDSDHEIWIAVPTLSFPTLSYDLDNDYTDTIEYYLNEWTNIGKSISAVNKVDFDFTAFSEEYSEIAVESATILGGDLDEPILPGDEEILYDDTQYMLGEGGTLSLADIKKIWNNLYDSDECMAGFSSFDEWWGATRPYLNEVEACESVMSSSDSEELGEKAARLTGIDEWDITHQIKEANEIYSFDGSGEITDVTPNEDNTKVSITLHLVGQNEYEDGEYEDIDDDFTCEFPVVNTDEPVMSSIYDEDDELSGWREISHKMVPDSDGFITDYTLYESTSDMNSCQYICMFGDKDVYTPDEGHADWSGDDLGEAEEWFESYTGLGDDDILSSTDEELDDGAPLSVDGFMEMFEIMVDLSIREQAADILYNWYKLEGETSMPDRSDVLDMCDAADEGEDKQIVLEALGER